MLRKCVAEPQLILQNLQEYSCTPCLLNNHMGSFSVNISFLVHDITYGKRMHDLSYFNIM